ncbi:hypothetical protein [Pseudoleptotrichia goodfellowii]|uniref:Uncharacterized protein n=1 Tax=Pseudoleptotrichia goodfellowii F0264 TaxID=596323 RepID=D0GK21_9FUSO|nr:hypothetical protein [Pseudoleptotrichia goodfellowii]EEY35562.1 hypothetical protein HMPREF0554_2217 [Pseudoleptotrichia goodfellowii F0264]
MIVMGVINYIIYIFTGLLLLSLKNCGYLKIKNGKLQVIIGTLDILYTITYHIFFGIGMAILTLETEYSVYKIAFILICLLIIPIGVYKITIIIKKIFNIGKNDLKKYIISIEIIDLSVFLIQNVILVLIDNQIS